MSSKGKRRGSLKPKNVALGKNNSSTNLYSINSLMGIYGGKVFKAPVKSSSAQSFLTGLRNFNRLAHNA